jgi:hypothetical protein
MDKKTKEMLKELVNCTDLIPRRIWRDILWLQDDERLGIKRNGHFVWKTQKESKEGTWKTFFVKKFGRRRWNEHQIRTIIQDYLLFSKGDTLTARDIISCRNAEIRRLLLRGFGYEKFVMELGGAVIHRDGDSELILIKWGIYEDALKLVKVKDPSTGDFYILRVPLSVKTCKEAIAWTFGMSEEDYDLIKET